MQECSPSPDALGHAPEFLPAAMHATPPSPIVKLDEPVLEQRHCNEGDVPQVSGEKLFSKNSWKQSVAHGGINLVNSSERVKRAITDVVVVHNAQSNNGLAAMLCDLCRHPSQYSSSGYYVMFPLPAT